MLGDGTKIDRSEPIKIMDEVYRFYSYAIIKTDGTLWRWDDKDPTPKKEDDLDDVEGMYSRWYYLKNDGSLCTFGFENGYEVVVRQITENIKLPSTVIID